MARSMTGFGGGEAHREGLTFIVEMRSVNNRYLDVSVRSPRELSVFDDRIRRMASRAVRRGRIDVRVTMEDMRDKTARITVDEGLATGYLAAMRGLASRLGLPDDVGVRTIASMEGVIGLTGLADDPEDLWPLLAEAVAGALARLVSSREEEGRQLAVQLADKMAAVARLTTSIEARAPQVVEAYRKRLAARVAEILSVASAVMDSARLEAEVAMFAERCSIAEEVARLRSHLKQLEPELDGNGSGRKMDFLVQEMFREANTIAAKACDLEIVSHVLELKGVLEDVREQVQNLE